MSDGSFKAGGILTPASQSDGCVECRVIARTIEHANWLDIACHSCGAIHIGKNHSGLRLLKEPVDALRERKYPTNYFQWVRRDSEAPSRVLQQWWATRYSEAVRLKQPEECQGGGEWRDVPNGESK